MCCSTQPKLTNSNSKLYQSWVIDLSLRITCSTSLRTTLNINLGDLDIPMHPQILSMACSIWFSLPSTDPGYLTPVVSPTQRNTNKRINLAFNHLHLAKDSSADKVRNQCPNYGGYHDWLPLKSATQSQDRTIFIINWHKKLITVFITLIIF